MKADEAKRLKSLEAENQRLKKLVAEQAVDIDMLRSCPGETSNPGTQTQGCVSARGVFWDFTAPCLRGGPASLEAAQTRAGTQAGG
jgi:hypothetical protein